MSETFSSQILDSYFIGSEILLSGTAMSIALKTCCPNQKQLLWTWGRRESECIKADPARAPSHAGGQSNSQSQTAEIIWSTSLHSTGSGYTCRLHPKGLSTSQYHSDQTHQQFRYLLEEVFGKGPTSDELFVTFYYTLSLTHVAAAGKEAYPPPMYSNVWQDRAGENNDKGQRLPNRRSQARLEFGSSLPNFRSS